MTRYLIVVEGADSDFSTYAPDVPGCVSAGDTVEAAIHNMREALALHLEGEELPPVRTRLGDTLVLDQSAVAVVELDLPVPTLA